MSDHKNFYTEMQKLDRLKTEVPDNKQLMERLSFMEKAERHTLIKELSLFSLLGCLIVIAILQIMADFPALFLVLQVLVMVLLPLLIYLDHRRIRRSRGRIR